MRDGSFYANAIRTACAPPAASEARLKNTWPPSAQNSSPRRIRPQDEQAKKFIGVYSF
jgi:hypothetical protein